MAIRDKPLGPRYNPATAFFWGAFVDEGGLQERDCEVFKLYETEDGKFFYVRAGHSGRKPEEGPLTADSTRQTAPVLGMQAHVFDKSIEVDEWLERTLAPLKAWIQSG